jgi:hypothetical protein
MQYTDSWASTRKPAADATLTIRPGRLAVIGAPGCLRDEERTLGVGVHHEVVVGLLEVAGPLGDAHPRVVHQDVERTERRLGRRDAGAHRGDVGDVHRNRMRPPAGPLDLGFEHLEPVGPSRGERNVSAGLREGGREAPAEPGRCAGDERVLAVDSQLHLCLHGGGCRDYGARGLHSRGRDRSGTTMTHLLRTCDRGVLRVTINRRAKRNALSREALQELRTVFEAHVVREDLRLALVGGAGGGCRAEFKAV